VLTLIAIPVITFSDGMIWPLAERVGVAIGIAPRTIGFILAVSFFSGLSGTWLADHLGDRFGYTRPILAGAWGTATGGLLIATLATVPGYIVGTFAKNVAIFFLMPYLLSAAAAMDPRGRMSAAAGGLIPLGFGTGPIVAGHLIERSGYPILGWTGLCAVAIASLLLIPGFLSLHKLRSSRV